MSLMAILIKGGYLMLALALCSITAVVIIVERFLFYRNASLNKIVFLSDLRKSIGSGVPTAKEVCRRYKGTIPEIIIAGLDHFDGGAEAIRKNMEVRSIKKLHEAERFLGALATIVAISPLIGFLGTVIGMIKAFMKIEFLGGNVNASVLAGGIWEALITTAAGLSVAIVAYIFYNYFVGRVDTLSRDIAEVTEEAMNIYHTTRRGE